MMFELIALGLHPPSHSELLGFPVSARVRTWGAQHKQLNEGDLDQASKRCLIHLRGMIPRAAFGLSRS